MHSLGNFESNMIFLKECQIKNVFCSEVINALVRESKARDGDIEKSRVRLNMNFFQRTVTGMVSSNQRYVLTLKLETVRFLNGLHFSITSRQERKIAEERQKNAKYKSRKVIGRTRTARELINEILTSQTKFVQSSVTEDTHFNPKLDITCDSNLHHVNQGQTELGIFPEELKNTELLNNSSVISFSDDEITKTTENDFISKPSVVLSDYPIQISSDEGNTNAISVDVDYCYKKKKCKKRHKYSKSKKKIRS